MVKVEAAVEVMREWVCLEEDDEVFSFDFSFGFCVEMEWFNRG